MDNSNLTQLEIKNLMNLYQSEIKKLLFQLSKTQETLSELNYMLENPEDINAFLNETTPLYGHSPYSGPSDPIDGYVRRTKRRRRRSKGGYKLNDWDLFIIETIQNASEPLINKEIHDAAAKAFPDETEEEIKGRISRSIHKLANKRKVLLKHRYEGRGFAYTVNPSAKWKE